MSEEWRVVPGHPDYDVSSRGRIRSRKRKTVKLLTDKPHIKTGYTFVRLDGKSYGVHCVVALTWHGPCPDGMEVDHINEVRNDNRPENLRYLTKAENLARRVWDLAEECAHGHKLSGDSLYIRPSNGRRECRQCSADRAARGKARTDRPDCSEAECDRMATCRLRSDYPICELHYQRERVARRRGMAP